MHTDFLEEKLHSTTTLHYMGDEKAEPVEAPLF